MDRAEVLKIMSVLRGAYPQFYRDISRKEADAIVGLWEDVFRDDEYRLVAAAVKALIESDEKGYPPHIGAVKAKLRLITGTGELTEAEAWNLVAKALRNSGYCAREEFDKLPPVIQRIVGSPSQLHEWSMMDSETVHSVVASNFQRAYRTAAKREQDLARLPSDVRELIGRASKKLALGDGGG